MREAVERACNYFVYLHDMNKAKVGQLIDELCCYAKLPITYGEQCDSLAEELHFHKSIYSTQVSYVTSLIDAIRCEWFVVQYTSNSCQNKVRLP